ncbi:MAG: 3-carboxy-cis,cis-muconate cycloisomerase, partial [Rhodospirillaceae bacterium]|nr:3-carboxy-cis,cis-muconate cycloisomerase [Rhodospirillaceae bacterium]
LADRHRGTVMAARTRNQQAVPTTFGLKIAGWIAPLLRQRRRLDTLQSSGQMLQMGGAGGTLAALGDQGPATAAALAAELQLTLPAMPWHNQRDIVIDIANWLSLLSGSLGKTAGDILLLAQTEVGEVRIAGAGGSSAMPQKTNPVLAEAVLTLARHSAGQIGAMHQTAQHLHERDGAAWTQEWLTLPGMIRAGGAGLRLSQEIAQGLEVDKGRMTANMSPTLLAEAAAYKLSEHMPKSEAQALVKTACTEATADQDMFDLLETLTSAPVDWTALRNPANYLGAADKYINAVLKEIRR